ncbi:MAG: amino acid ABC transporter ATP-binding/permease protein [Bacillales bacterium]
MKKRSSLITIFKLLSFIQSSWYIIVLAVFSGYLSHILSISIIVFSSIGFIKLLNPSYISLSYFVIYLIVILCALFKGIFKYLEQYNNHLIAFKLLSKLRHHIFYKLRILSPSKLEDKEKGQLISLITADVETIEVFYAHTISPILIATLILITSFIVITIFSSIFFALLALCSYLTIGLIIPLIFYKLNKKNGEKYRQDFSSFSSYYLENLKGIKEIIFARNENKISLKIKEKGENLNKINNKIRNINIYESSLCIFILSFTILSSLILGINLISINLINFKEFIIGFTIIFSSFGPFMSLGNLPSNLVHTFACGNRILDLLEEDPKVLPITNKIDINHFTNLEVRNLNFSYQSNEKNILNNFSFKINKGEIVGIYGRSGIGKSTILKLLLRFYKVEDNSIFYNNIDINNINTSSLYNKVTLISQNPHLFNDSIYNNLIFVKPDANLKEVREACKKANIDELIMSLPNKYDTTIEEFGTNFSTGEKQRISLARAFLSGSELILLDEVTSNIDIFNESHILNSIVENSKNKTFIIISHRLSSLSISDKIIKL